MAGSPGAALYLNTDVNYKGLLMELAFLFPGQGSQSPDMLQELALNHPRRATGEIRLRAVESM